MRGALVPFDPSFGVESEWKMSSFCRVKTPGMYEIFLHLYVRNISLSRLLLNPKNSKNYASMKHFTFTTAFNNLTDTHAMLRRVSMGNHLNNTNFITISRNSAQTGHKMPRSEATGKSGGVLPFCMCVSLYSTENNWQGIAGRRVGVRVAGLRSGSGFWGVKVRPGREQGTTPTEAFFCPANSPTPQGDSYLASAWRRCCLPAAGEPARPNEWRREKSDKRKEWLTAAQRNISCWRESLRRTEEEYQIKRVLSCWEPRDKALQGKRDAEFV